MKKLVLICSVCGGGKSTIVAKLNKMNFPLNFVFTEADNLGINCWDYKNKNERNLYEDCIIKSFDIACEKNVLFASCINPIEYYEKVKKLRMLNLILSF